jgi:UDP-N-acetylglucosamine 2-epimerase (non-hydrolysing)
VGKTMMAYEKVCLRERPDLVVVVGDVNATMACSVTAKKLGIEVAHLEAGIRSFDRTMPEEINRMVTDSVCDYHWTPSIDANENLIHEGIDRSRLYLVGNIMIDSLEMMRSEIEAEDSARSYDLKPGSYAVATFHRPSNVDTKEKLSELVEALEAISSSTPIVFPIHPRTFKCLNDFNLYGRLSNSGVIVSEPLGYKQFLSLIFDSAYVLTDSGGIQEETTYLGIPCLTVRDNTERPITVTEGTNTLVKISELTEYARKIETGMYKKGTIPVRWDGHTAGRVVAQCESIQNSYEL